MGEARLTVGAGCVVEREEARARRPRLDWATLQRKTSEADVWQCLCGGRTEEVLRNMGLLSSHAAQAPRPGHSPPQFALAV